MDQATFDLVITDIANGGDGIGRLPDGRAVFVPFTIPGETVRATVVEEKKGYVRGELKEVINSCQEPYSAALQAFWYLWGMSFSTFGIPGPTRNKNEDH